MDQRAIGIFDSGVGGLTTVKVLRRLLPNERIIYFGDTGRVPYGSRGREIIRQYAMQDIAFLKRHEVKMIVIACGTVSSCMTPQMQDSIGLPYSGVVLPAAQAACATTSSGRIGIIGTTATVRSAAYSRAIRNILPHARTFGNACPLFVPLVENGFIQPDNQVTELVARQYLAPILEADVDTLIMGCTHYPLIAPILQKIMGPDVTLVDVGEQVARWAQSYLTSNDMLRQGEGGCEFFVSDSPENFIETAGLFLGGDITGEVQQISVDSISPSAI